MTWLFHLYSPISYFEFFHRRHEAFIGVMNAAEEIRKASKHISMFTKGGKIYSHHNKKLAPLGIMETHLKAPLKPLEQLGSMVPRGSRRANNWAPRAVSLSDSWCNVLQPQAWPWRALPLETRRQKFTDMFKVKSDTFKRGIGILVMQHISAGILPMITGAILVRIHCWNVSIYLDPNDSLKRVVYVGIIFSV